ncbi:MAG: ribokinase [Demequinaceae bacterium]|nr:ribokinase [Demequinaceae bacterium]
MVLGSINRDHAVVVDHHPKPGETVLGDSYTYGSGGKGANQAVAAALAGVTPILLSAVGDDSAGEELLADLRRVGVDTTHVTRHAGMPSGIALITVSRDGENAIVVAPGAGAAVDASTTAKTVASISTPGSVLLSQLELPLPAVVASGVAAHEAGARVVLNLSPFQAVPEELIRLADPLVVNAGEAEGLAGERIASVADAENAARTLASRCRSIVITLGAEGAVAAEADSVRSFPARKVPVVDTTGAGDSFAGALAAALVTGASLDRAVLAGIDAAAITVQHLGAQGPIP